MKKIYYGWWLLAGLFLIYAASNGIGLNTLPLFYPELIKEYGWTQEQVTGPASLMYLLIALFSPFVGILLDRFKTKTIMLLGAVGLVGGLLLYANIQSLGHLTAFYVLYAFAITLAGIVPSMYLITRWFIKFRGLAVGIFLMASSVGGGIFPPLTGYLIEEVNWQRAAIVLGVIAAVLIVPSVLLLIKNKPEDLGLRPDGVSEEEADKDFSFKAGKGVTLREAIRTPIFYLLLLITASMWFCITGVINNQALYFSDLGANAKLTGYISGVFFIASLSGKLLFGFLSDRFGKKQIMFAATLNLLLGSCLLPLLTEDALWLMYVYAIIYGIGFSGAFTMIQVVVAEFYQGQSYGKILGIVTGIDTFAGSLGIIILSSMRTRLGTYLPSFYLMIGICVLAAICVLFLKKPQKALDPNV